MWTRDFRFLSRRVYRGLTDVSVSGFEVYDSGFWFGLWDFGVLFRVRDCRF